MTHRIHVKSVPEWAPFASTLRQAASLSLAECAADPGELTLVLTSGAEIQAFNKRFAGLDAETDVLSFPDGSQTDDGTGLYYGDVLLAVPVAERQAQAAGHTLSDELTLLVVHGVLHLLGHDHHSRQQQKEMWRIQDWVLERLGCPARPVMREG